MLSSWRLHKDLSIHAQKTEYGSSFGLSVELWPKTFNKIYTELVHRHSYNNLYDQQIQNLNATENLLQRRVYKREPMIVGHLERLLPALVLKAHCPPWFK
ncbi:hypothetical protein ILYODFUR_014318 [Ilyodon furcidens]|uniref:Uncharacterized protein n=1 Tax=Ilyodon furcidens TaxID=33524 RepID=A0ABV0U777_9TELE